MEKFVCLECDKIATWFYIPDDRDKDSVYCDLHVPRGCSCNINPKTGIEDVDEQGRLYPCCEYGYDVDGWDKEKYRKK